MQRRRRIKQTVSLNDRLATFAEQLKAKATELRPGPERDALLKRARIADTASHIDEWANGGVGRRSNHPGVGNF
jgi:cell division protein FtsB